MLILILMLMIMMGEGSHASSFAYTVAIDIVVMCGKLNPKPWHNINGQNIIQLAI